MVNIRLRAVILLLVFLGLLYIFIYQLSFNNESSLTNNKNVATEEFLAPSLWDWKDSNSAWHRENVFINNNIFLRQGGGYDIKVENYDVLKENPRPYRILLFGDSFTWGNGADDPQSNISLRIQEELNARSKPGTFLVLPVAANGRNTFSYVDHFTPNIIKKLKPDLVIYNYVYNDMIPNFDESMICLSNDGCKDQYIPKYNPQYRDCLAGRSGIMGRIISTFVRPISFKNSDALLARYCEPLLNKLSREGFDEERYISKPKENPYYGVWMDAVGKLKSQFAPVPIFFVESKLGNLPLNVYSDVENVFKDKGYNIIKSPWGEKVARSNVKGANIVDRVNVNPGNSHYSLYANVSFAKDISKEILKYLGESKIKEISSKNNSIKIEKPLVNNTLPIISKVKNGEVVSKVSYDPREQIGKYKGQEGVLFQGVSCMNINHPNFIANLDYSLIKSGIKGLKVGIDNKELSIGYFYYDENLRKIFVLNPPKVDGKYNIEVNSKNYSYSIFAYDLRYGCPLNKIIDLPKFSMEIEKVK